MSKSKGDSFDAAVDRQARTPIATLTFAPVQIARVPTSVSALDARAALGVEVLEGNGLLEQQGRYTSEAAREKGLPLRRFKLSQLVVHPYNVRPESAHHDLKGLSDQLRTEGQQDPIHVIPYKGGHAIMEGQRRWLAAPEAGLTELDAWVHPKPMDEFEVYAFGQMIHESRKDTTAFDQAVVWGRMIEDGLFATGVELARRANVDVSKVSRSLSILKMPPSVLEQIRRATTRFTERHLTSIAQVNEHAGSDIAAAVARSVAEAEVDKPVSARKLEALAESYKTSGDAPRRGRRKNSVPIAIRSANGDVLGAIKAFRDGRLEFKPQRVLSEANAEQLADLVFAVCTSH